MMKKFSLFPIAAALALAVSCEKPLTEAEKNAQIEREVQQRLAAERQADDAQKLAQQQADLAAREQALADKEAASSEDAVAVATPHATALPEVQSDDRSVSSSDSRSPRSYDTFYRKLEPYGAWRETNDYGYVWQPREAQSRNWRPYTDGRWAYTDAGWTWVSNEPFGWATYHYGRWTRLRGVGWVWVPGDEWAPAWVSWRSSDQHVGWAPLPPEARFEKKTGIKKWADSYYDIDVDEYAFIPNEDIGSENIERSVIPVERNVTIVNETTNVTDITYSNTTIINEGPNYDQLRGRSRRPLERMRLERQYNVEESQSPQATMRGDVLAIMSPVFTARAVERPRNVGAPITQVVVERGSATNANQPEVQRARAKMKAEATAPSDAPAKKFEKPAVVASTSAPVPASPTPAPPVATATPRTMPPPAASPTATPRAAMSAPPSTPVATATPRQLPQTTASPVVRPSVPLATATPTPKPVASPTPKPVASPTPKPVATPTPTPLTTTPPKPLATPTPRPLTSPAPTAALTPPKPPISAPPVATPTPRPISTPTPIAAKLPALVPTATTAITSPIPAASKPVPATTLAPANKPAPGVTDPAERDPSAGGSAKGRDLRQSPGAGKTEQQQKRDEALNAKVSETAAGSISAPKAAVPPPPTVGTKPAAVAASVSPTPTPTPTPGGRNAGKPGRGDDAPRAKPGGPEKP